MNIAMEYPALNGQTVTQAHADHCAANGHATHTNDGVVSPWCPRCGASTITPEDLTAKFDAIIDAERDVREARATMGFGIDHATRTRAHNDHGKARKVLAARVNALSLDELTKFNDYRIALRDAARKA